ncbi:3-alpha-hydroxysteroid dehydrogenase [Tardibacter chloracetimidivorans]|uniref:3-alpha-hydroxysteroid dehydrogenase n=1 Tax=Tardibacter chloracetimidivorans TaxID=1921510 RepID=A0A1L3ZSW0_9SPHN|nr:3-alpha-hydroxysteroid dehydrogenase [Tardibacter chloracetimidivorans]
MGRASGKVAVITGGARGMGAAFARRLVEEGASVVLTDVLSDEGLATAEALGDHAHFIAHDVTQADQWAKVVEVAERRFGPISVLVNNAGIAAYGPIEDTSEVEFRRIVDINMVSIFLGTKAVIPSMRRAGGGAIINISSAAGIVGLPQMLGYVGTKFAVRGMTKSAALELAPLNIRVNSIHPGTIDTPMSQLSGDPELTAAVNSVTPAGRVGQPDEIASVVVLLASDECAFATGAEFVIDGGLTCH